MATHLVVDPPHKHAPCEGLDDDSSPADPLVGPAGPPHAVLLLKHHSSLGPPQMLGQPGEGQSGWAMLTAASEPVMNASPSPLGPARIPPGQANPHHPDRL